MNEWFVIVCPKCKSEKVNLLKIKSKWIAIIRCKQCGYEGEFNAEKNRKPLK